MEEIENEIRNLKNALFTESLPYIFTDWQIKIIKKRLNKERLTDSEKVEFSCNIKKKIIAIQNRDIKKSREEVKKEVTDDIGNWRRITYPVNVDMDKAKKLSETTND